MVSAPAVNSRKTSSSQGLNPRGSMEILPPPQYDHPFKGHTVVRLGSLAEIKNYCHTMQGIVSAYQALGCAKVNPGRCFIMIPESRRPDHRAHAG